MEAVKQDPFEFIVRARQRAKTDPVWFAREILQLKRLPGEPSLEENPDLSWELDDWTVELLEATADVVRKIEGKPTKFNHKGLNQISVRSMHGPGKTFGLALLMHWFGFSFYGRNPCTAPKLTQMKRRLWPEFRKIRNRAIEGYSLLQDVQTEAIHWMGADGTPDPDHSSFMETATAPENLAGLHGRYMLICVDEASGVSENLWPVIEGAISTGLIVLLVIISNPTRQQGTFAASHLKPNVSKNWYRMHISLDKTSRVSRQWVKRMEEKYGPDSPIVKVRCYGEFASEDENQLIALDWLLQARYDDRDQNGDGSIPRKRMTIDAADGGGNFTVITIALHFDSYVYLLKQNEYSFPGGTAVSRTVQEAKKLYQEYGMDVRNGDDIVVDSLGVGAGVCSGLVDCGYSVVRYMGGSKSDNSSLYRNRRVQSYLVARDYFRESKIVFADDFVGLDEWDDVDGQLCSICRKVSNDALEDLPTKEEMKRAGITSPDRADGIAMQFATQSPMRQSGIADLMLMGSQLESAGYDGSIT